MSSDSKAIDALLEAVEAHAAELEKRSGVDAAIMLVLSALAKELKLTSDPDKTIERLKTTFLFSRLRDGEIEAAGKALEMILKNSGR